MFRVIRCTTQQLEGALNGAAQEDVIHSVHHTGGRDWIIVCRKGDDADARMAKLVTGGLREFSVSTPFADATRKGAADVKHLRGVVEKLEARLKDLGKDVDRGAREGIRKGDDQ